MAHEDPNRKTGDWTEGGDTLDFTGLGNPGEMNGLFLSRSQTMQVVQKHVHPFVTDHLPLI